MEREPGNRHQLCVHQTAREEGEQGTVVTGFVAGLGALTVSGFLWHF